MKDWVVGLSQGFAAMAVLLAILDFFYDFDRFRGEALTSVFIGLALVGAVAVLLIFRIGRKKPGERSE